MGYVCRGPQPTTVGFHNLNGRSRVPYPCRLDLVVKKALKSRSAFSAEIPTPQSVTLTSTCCVSSWRDKAFKEFRAAGGEGMTCVSGARRFIDG
jgi:hypothetical protein